MGAVCVQIVEGNPHLRSLLGWHLQQAGYWVYQSADIHQAREVFQSRQPTLVVLDSDLSGGDGLEFCRWLQQQQQSMILMLSARNTEADIVEGLKAGADDYLTKPFGMQEFQARVEALTRRTRAVVAPLQLEYGDLTIDLVQRRARFQDEFIDLTPQEFSLLYILAQAGGAPLSRSELLRRAWPDEIDNPRTVDTHVLSLRKKIETDPRQPSLIQTVRNVGYRFNLEVLTPNAAAVAERSHARQGAIPADPSAFRMATSDGRHF
ncbi:response regulator transcription factor [Trichocoleus sp. FACHB-262]|nr:response regulator [Trichocoleus sp. FACHB-262]MBD2123482.1 response regulator transcription factor [Trichocoleus sp. FACHB-262]